MRRVRSKPLDDGSVTLAMIQALIPLGLRSVNVCHGASDVA